MTFSYHLELIEWNIKKLRISHSNSILFSFFPSPRHSRILQTSFCIRKILQLNTFFQLVSRNLIKIFCYSEHFIENSKIIAWCIDWICTHNLWATTHHSWVTWQQNWYRWHLHSTATSLRIDEYRKDETRRREKNKNDSSTNRFCCCHCQKCQTRRYQVVFRYKLKMKMRTNAFSIISSIVKILQTLSAVWYYVDSSTMTTTSDPMIKNWIKKLSIISHWLNFAPYCSSDFLQD